MPHPRSAPTSRVLLIALALVIGNAGCQPSTESSNPPRFFNTPVTAWISFDAATGIATVTPNHLPISDAAREYPLWRPVTGTPDFEIDFIDAPPDKCVNRPKPATKLPKPTCIKGKSCRTIKPKPEHYGCHAYVITLHRPGEPDVKTDPEIEVDR
jgi:hypothetical protein